MQVDVQTILRSGAALTDEALERLLPSAALPPHSIHRAMRHSTFAGGKRLRPILLIEAAKMAASVDWLGDRPEPDTGTAGLGTEPGFDAGAADLGAALEMLHTYSLIHDDLPALDNDDLRRGQPTCHVVFGEAIAILAGDALQTLAFQTIGSLPVPPQAVIEILREVSAATGTGVGRFRERETGLRPGMIGGQVVDLESEGTTPTAELVETIHRSKTGALIAVSILAGAIYGAYGASKSSRAARHTTAALQSEPAGMPASQLERIRTFGEKAGLAFQIVDDILDVTGSSEQLGKTAGKDTATDKATWPAVFGLERSRHDAQELIADAFAALEPFGPAADPLKAVARYLVDRNH